MKQINYEKLRKVIAGFLRASVSIVNLTFNYLDDSNDFNITFHVRLPKPKAARAKQ